jgi:hypothetical protein
MKRFSTLFMFLLVVVAMSAGNKSWITKVYDFLPAPGQFVNTLPEYTAGDTRESIIAKVSTAICGNDDDGAMPGMISLGSFGGYVVFGFDHPVVNVSGEYDFKVYGNAFASSSDSRGGSSEPGIVMVSRDDNHNGIPDDKWYELAGSEYKNPKTKHGYKITYYRPDENKTPTPSTTSKYLTDTTYVRWTSNDTDSLSAGYVSRNSYHTQSYWPKWLADSDSTINFTGTKLPCNAHDTSGKGSYYVLYFFDWGYVDNRSNTTDPGFKIDWAVDSDGNAVKLSQIDFVKVYCAENQYCGWIGETSTEVCGAEDLHPDAAGVNSITAGSSKLILLNSAAGTLALRNAGDPCEVAIYTTGGSEVMNVSLASGDNSIDVGGLAHGIYIVKAAGVQAIKFAR